MTNTHRLIGNVLLLGIAVVLCNIVLCNNYLLAQHSLTHTFRDSASSSVTLVRDTDDGYEELDQITKTTSYHIVGEWDTSFEKHMLISESKTEHTHSGWDGSEGKIVLSAALEDDNFSKSIWTKTIDATDILYLDNYFQAVVYGCCGADNGNMIYRYSDGKKLMNFSSDLATVDIPNQRTKRYIGVLSADGSLPMPDFDSDRAFVALITYIDPNSMQRQQVVLRSSHLRDTSEYEIPYLVSLSFTPLLPHDSSSYRGKTELTLWSATEANDYSNFTIDVTFELDDSVVVHIPVKNDKLDISSFKSDWFDASLR